MQLGSEALLLLWATRRCFDARSLRQLWGKSSSAFEPNCIENSAKLHYVDEIEALGFAVVTRLLCDADLKSLYHGPQLALSAISLGQSQLLAGEFARAAGRFFSAQHPAALHGRAVDAEGFSKLRI